MEKWTKESIWYVLQTDEEQLIKALHRLAKFQTNDERKVKDSLYKNHEGFNRFDAPRMTTYLRKSEKQSLTPREMRWLRSHMKKYCTQLADIVNEKKGL